MPQKAHLLIVDDEANTLASLARAFRLAGHEATVCDNAAKAFDLARSQHFDLILSDVVMPGKDGLAFIREVRANESLAQMPRLPAVALTAFARAEDRIRVLQAGYNSHVSKPIDPRELVAVVESLAAGN